MAFVVKYLQDIPKDCGKCPCSIHITPKEVYCNARQKHFEVTDERPDECEIMEEKYKPETKEQTPMEQTLNFLKYIYLQNKEEVDKVAQEFKAESEVSE